MDAGSEGGPHSDAPHDAARDAPGEAGPSDARPDGPRDASHDAHHDASGSTDGPVDAAIDSSPGDAGPACTLFLPNSPQLAGGESMTSGDYDGDGALDLAFVSGGTVTVYLGRADGSFGPGISYASGDNPGAGATADMNGDGKLDIVVANGTNAGVSVLLGNGDGTFVPALSSPPAIAAPTLALGDFDGDGAPDVALGYAGKVTVRLGHGDGKFGSPVDYATLPGADGVVVAANFDGDGVLDLVVASSGTPGTEYCGYYCDYVEAGPPGGLSFLRGKGDGKFAAAVNLIPPYYLRGVVTADFDGDGHADLLILDPDGVQVDSLGYLFTLLGHGDGTFAAPVAASPESVSGAITPGDFDGDGKIDLLLTSGAILLGLGDGTFAAAVYPGLNEPVLSGAAALAGDFNGDGKLDVVSTAGDVLLGHGDGTLLSPALYAADHDTWGVVIDDFNGDGHPDLAVTNSSGGDVSVLLGAGDGTFASAVNYGVGSIPEGIATADFDGDGNRDLAVTDDESNAVSVLLGHGDGTFKSEKKYHVGNLPHALVTGDFDADGDADIVALNGLSGDVSLLRGKGDGTFKAALDTVVGKQLNAIAAGDFDGDGSLDLAVTQYGPPSGLNVLLGWGDGSFKDPVFYDTSSAQGLAIASVDLDGDGALDLVTVIWSGGNNVLVLRGVGDGTFEPGVAYYSGCSANALAVGDLDGDGKLDLAVACDGSVHVLPGRGDATFASALVFPAPGPGSGGLSLAAADLDGDGKLDLVLADGASEIGVSPNETKCVP